MSNMSQKVTQRDLSYGTLQTGILGVHFEGEI